MSLKLYAEIPYKLLRKRSLGPVLSTPPPLPLIALSPDDEWEEFDTATQTGFGYALPHLSSLDESEAHKHVDRDSVAVPSEAPRRARLLSEYMTNNEFFQSPRHGFGLETRLLYKRSKELEGGSVASTNLSDEISFSATFESGNLDRAYRVYGRRYASSHELLMLHNSSFFGNNLTRSCEPGMSSTKAPASQTSMMPFQFLVDVDYEYDLYADTDVNTQGCIQWYFFRVTIPSILLQQARERGATSLKARFNIRNMLKTASLYTEGMLPAVHIESPATLKCGWHHSGANVCYFKNTDTYRHRRTGKVRNYYTLSFVYEFPVQPPSSPKASGQAQNFSQDDEKDSITKRRNSLEARFLRHHFVFKVVPMLNPDGVIHGNYRCSLAGTDLNRRWLNPSSELHPTIFATKNMLLSVRKTRHVSLYCDLHGHSRKKNIFLYGCRPFDPGSRSEAARVRLFPHILCKTSDCAHGGFFSFGDCTFSVTASKKGTGRVVVWNEMQVLHSFTLEASFFGVDADVHKSRLQQTAPNSRGRVKLELTEQISSSLRHFTSADLHAAGLKFCHALLPFSQVLALQRASTVVMPPSPKLSTRSRAEQDELVNAEQRRVLDSSEPPIPVRCFGPTTTVNDFVSNNTVRLAPLGSSQLPINLPKEHDMSWIRPQKPASPPLDPVPSNRLSENCDASSSGLPSEFDQLFSGEDMSMLSLLDHDDLISEIEAALPDNFQDNPEEDDSVGSESDPSADTTEEEEKGEQQKTPPENVEEPQATEAEPAKLAVPMFSRNRPPRVTRHLSEPRFSPSQRDTNSAHLVCQNIPYDRNREIAAMHLHAVQRRSKVRRNTRHATLEVDEI
ncbi:Peptidase M14, carboxypeptidase A [Phytophthora cactorum]|nr:Peptidase M14, carboxypeptidase A [Phytophthora cactorum]